MVYRYLQFFRPWLAIFNCFSTCLSLIGCDLSNSCYFTYILFNMAAAFSERSINIDIPKNFFHIFKVQFQYNNSKIFFILNTIHSSVRFVNHATPTVRKPKSNQFEHFHEYLCVISLFITFTILYSMSMYSIASTGLEKLLVLVACVWCCFVSIAYNLSCAITNPDRVKVHPGQIILPLWDPAICTKIILHPIYHESNKP